MYMPLVLPMAISITGLLLIAAGCQAGAGAPAGACQETKEAEGAQAAQTAGRAGVARHQIGGRQALVEITLPADMQRAAWPGMVAWSMKPSTT